MRRKPGFGLGRITKGASRRIDNASKSSFLERDIHYLSLRGGEGLRVARRSRRLYPAQAYLSFPTHEGTREDTHLRAPRDLRTGAYALPTWPTRHVNAVRPLGSPIYYHEGEKRRRESETKAHNLPESALVVLCPHPGETQVREDPDRRHALFCARRDGLSRLKGHRQ